MGRKGGAKSKGEEPQSLCLWYASKIMKLGAKKQTIKKKLDLVKQQEEEVETRTHVLTTVV